MYCNEMSEFIQRIVAKASHALYAEKRKVSSIDVQKSTVKRVGQRVLCQHVGDREQMPDHHITPPSPLLLTTREKPFYQNKCVVRLWGEMHVLRGPGPFPIAVALTGGKYQKKQIVIRFKLENSVPVGKCPVGSPVRTHWLLTHAQTDGQVENNTAAAHPVGRRRHTNSVRLSREQNHNSSCQQNDITIAVIFLLFHWPI